ncbi:MAG: hypothetical protein HYV07_12470, partial [Deltaproteobacteria bacterium]|nr:hypothetical protein [Deltaproteobacteria bacterium]
MALEDLPCLTDEQTFVIEFLETRNRPPVFTSTPVTFAALSPSIGPNQPMILSDWTVTQFAGGDPAPSWVVAPSGTSVEQQLNSDPSFFLSDFESVGERIDGTWYVNAGDNDYVGFVFGYQDAAHFYLMSWKAGTQGAALAGID